MNKLPNGWAEVPLSDLAGNRSGNGSLIKGKLSDRRTNESPYPGFSASGQDVWLSSFDQEGKAIIISAVGARCGKAFEAEGKWSAIANTHIVRPKEEVVNSRLLWYLLNDESFWVRGGSAQPFVKVNKTFERLVALPPIAEQKRIAEKLDALLSRVNACRARLDRVPDIVKRFRQSVLAAATSGQLTESWRAANGLDSQRWAEQRLGALCENNRIITYGVIKLGDEIHDGTPCLRTSNVRWLRIDRTGIKRISKNLSQEYSRTILKGGEVLVNVRGTLGGVAVAEEAMAGWNVSREVAVVPVDRKHLVPAFLAFSIGSETTQRWLGGVQRGVAYTGINIEDLRELPVAVPSLPEQNEIVRRVEILFTLADRIEVRLNDARTSVELLAPAIRSRAFRGELVPQDPNDEPASLLLGRLKNERAHSDVRVRRPKAGGTKGPRAPKAQDDMTKDRFDDEVKEQPYLRNLLRNATQPMAAEDLFKASELPLVDFYKQLAWEVKQGLIRDDKTKLEAV